ncbi:protein LURP-one-related 5-like [Malania oleifera]|uniref:protein LURP-one-related 5-like n=1 Tax=Malania oleifera TaxID=397392 RepID=UPI0025ADD884|nr:protein LURP-one-related 5-like [Malania oleifera]
MSRIFPAESSFCSRDFPGKAGEVSGEGRDFGGGEIKSLVPSSSVFTVWKKSSMSFEGTDGFTVFDDRGGLAFRVDNYSRKNTGFSASASLVVLMDGSGKPLLTLKPQRLSMQQQWSGYRGEDGCRKSNAPNLKLFSMRRPWRTRRDNNVSTEAEIFMERPGKSSRCPTRPDFRVDGSFRKRNCSIIRVQTGEVVARIARKKVNTKTPVVLSDEVFSLSVEAGCESELVMAFVVALDRICPEPFAPLLCF